MTPRKAALIAVVGAALLMPTLARVGRSADTAGRDTLRREALEVMRKAEDLFRDGKVLVAIDLLWQEAERLPPGQVADTVRFVAVRNRVYQFLRDGNARHAVRQMIEHAVQHSGADGREWLLLEVAGFYLVMGEYESAAETCRRILKEYGPPTDEDIAKSEREAPEDADIVHPRIALRQQSQAILDKLLLIGRPAPPLDVVDLDGRNVTPADYKGKVLLLDFWAADSPLALEQLPGLLALYARHKDIGFEILGLSADRDRDRLTAFLKARRVPWRQVFLGDAFERVGALYETNSVPARILVDADGVVRGIELQGAVLKERVRALLDKPAEADTTPGS